MDDQSGAIGRVEDEESPEDSESSSVARSRASDNPAFSTHPPTGPTAESQSMIDER